MLSAHLKNSRYGGENRGCCMPQYSSHKLATAC
uniref:Uncharacterized protein n=1 Tax=Anguilla anguilla TaxID=7936 RepID=A0A0E9TYX4_ANGAN